MTQSPARRRILLITYEFPPLGGGSARFSLNNALCLREMGYEVAIVTSRFGDLAAEEVVQGVPVYRIRVLRRHLNYANAVEVLSFGVSGMLAAGSIYKEFRPDLCIAYHALPTGMAAWAIKRRFGVPYMTYLLGQEVPGYPEPAAWVHKLSWPVNGRIWRDSDRLMANSQALADLASRAAPELDIAVATNGVDLDLFRPSATEAETRPPADGLLRVLYVGRLVPYKRLRELVRGFALALEKISAPIELHYVGFGRERAPIEAMRTELGIADRVIFHGRLEQAEVIEHMQRADCFVNIADMEGLPNAVLEAMACGLPVVLSDIAPHRELIEEGIQGALCDGKSPDSVAGALARVLGDAERRRQMGEASRARMEAGFSWMDVTRRLVSLFPADPSSGAGKE